MKLSPDDIKRVARLAHIEVTEEELPQNLIQLSGILNLIQPIQTVNTQQIQPMEHTQDIAQRLRTDIVTETDQHQQFQAIAPEVEDGYYLVPKVIE
ncbi:glutamyl-tRNA(Gln) amidotransferase subunit C [Nitrosomonas stercoris]|uniref:Aspartyl/glutamyl-tRNA(Asn/Gln) amidotransferase subunit C n=1 Tax=Nitrosomonas stercoris TaxID=1444684 RepID=A0A4Y1YJL5_9PROT|nr:glutamyl-tRNA(Gln) amidotransferase subunit C [Nitrosomonas stercoris]